jgi:hypothetical protein
VHKAMGVGLSYQFIFVLKLIVYSSGVSLFFLNLRPLKRIVWYFFFYILTPAILVLFWLFHGIFLALFSTILLFPLYPIAPLHRSDNLIVYEKFQGFMGACCSYELTERKHLIFEKEVGELTSNDSIDFEGTTLTIVGDSLEIEDEKIGRVKIFIP